MGLSYEEVEVTPDMANDWLESMDVNRRLSESNLEAIVLAMTEGRWHDDATPIRFNTKDRLIDGQHRLVALTVTGQTRQFLVVRGVPDTAMTTMDTGKTRSRADILSIHDPELKDAVSLAGGATICLRWSKGVRNNALRNTYVSNDEFIEFFDKNREALIHANRVGARVARNTAAITRQSATLCAYLFDAINREDAEFFWDRVIDGEGLAKGSPILALRRFFERESRTTRETIRADVGAALMIKTWNAYREGRDMELLTYRVGGAKPERFPEPV